MPARAAISSRLAAAKPFAAITSSAAATSARRVRSRLPPPAGLSFRPRAAPCSLDIGPFCTIGIKYSRYIPREAQMPKLSPLSPSPLGRHYEVAGRQLALHRAGAGGPSVVFLPGAGLIGLDYLNIQSEIAGSTTAVIYDRAGTGWSDAIALPRTAAAVAEELRALLAAAEVPLPYVLVGHSLGGAYLRRYAQLFPDEVAGLLFLDPSHEGYADFPRQAFLAQARQALAMLPALLNLRKFYRPKF